MIDKTNLFHASQVNPELLALCPTVPDQGAFVTLRGKMYHLVRWYDGRIYIVRRKGAERIAQRLAEIRARIQARTEVM